MKNKKLVTIFNKFLHYLLISSIFLSNTIINSTPTYAATLRDIYLFTGRVKLDDGSIIPYNVYKENLDSKIIVFDPSFSDNSYNSQTDAECDHTSEITSYNFWDLYYSSYKQIKEYEYIKISNVTYSIENLKVSNGKLCTISSNTILANIDEYNLTFSQNLRCTCDNGSSANSGSCGSCDFEYDDDSYHDGADETLYLVGFSFDTTSSNGYTKYVKQMSPEPYCNGLYRASITTNYISSVVASNCTLEYKNSLNEINTGEVPISSIEIEQPDCIVEFGTQLQLTTKILPEDASSYIRKVWSSDSDIATVTESGLVTFLNIGTVNITVTTLNGKTDTVTFTVIAPGSSGSGGADLIDVESITFPSASYTGTVGSQLQITPTITPTNATNTNLTWATTNASVATVNNGVVFCNGTGSATITATSNNGKFTYARVDVIAKPTNTNAPINFNIEPSFATVTSGQSINYSITGAVDANGETTQNISYVWHLGSTFIGTDPTLTMTAPNVTTQTTYQVKAINGSVTKYATLIVNPAPVSVTGIIVSPTSKTLTVGDTISIAHTLSPANVTDKTVNWSSSNTSVATVNSTGLVTAVGQGTASITASTPNGKSATVSITVNSKTIPVEKLTLNNYALTLNKGSASTLTATKYPTDANSGTGITFSSSNTSAATVNSSTGLITAINPGTAVITATAGSGATAQCTVTVPDTTIQVSSINFNTTVKNMTINSTFTPTVLYSPNNANTGKSISSWASSDTTVATVSSVGLITAKKEGTVTITATSSGGYVASLTINVLSSDINATSVTLNHSAKTLKLGQTLDLTATVNPSNSTKGTNLTWSKADDLISLSTTSGTTTKVTANKVGTSTVTVKTDTGLTAQCILTIEDSAIPVVSISLNKTQETLKVGQTSQLTTLINPTNATYGTAITYSSSNSAIASVSTSGLITAVSVGTATITAKSANNQIAQCVVTIQSTGIPVTSILLNTNNKVMNINETYQLTATTYPLNANVNKSLTWKSSDDTIATISNTGLITAKKEGTATITVQNSDGIFNNCQVQVLSNVVEVKQLNLNKTSEIINDKQTSQLEVSFYPTNATKGKTLTFTSSDVNIATVSSSGLVTALKPGVVTITVKNELGLTAQCIFNITSSDILVQQINLSENVKTMTVGESALLTYNYYPTNANVGTDFSWSSSDESVARVSDNGNIKAKGVGTATITLENDKGLISRCTITVLSKEIPVTSLVLNSTNEILKVGEQFRLTENIYPGNATEGTLFLKRSSNEDVASIDVFGVVTAKKVGTATITFANDKGVYATCQIQVVSNEIPVQQINFNKTSENLIVGDTSELEVSFYPTNATTGKTLTFETSNSEIATVSSTGLIRALKPGTVTITASNEFGLYKQCNVNVYSSDIPVSSIILNTGDLSLNKGVTFNLTHTIYPENATNKNVNFKSSNPDVASINSNGLITAISKGTTIISAVTEDGNKTVTINVDVREDLTKFEFGHTQYNYIGLNITEKLNLNIEPISAKPNRINYSSSNTNVAIIDTEGNLTTTGSGVAIITASTSDATYQTTTKVLVNVPVSSINFTEETIKIPVGKNFATNLIITPETATDKTIIYSSSDSNIVAVDSKGNLIGLAPGTATITATSHNNLTDTLTVNITQDVTSVSLSKSELILNEGFTDTLTAYIQPINTTDTEVLWYVEDTSIIKLQSISDNLKTVTLKALKEGKTNISVKAGNYIATAELTVLPSIKEISIVEENVELNLEDLITYKLNTTYSPANSFNNTLIFSSSNSDIVKVSSDGTLTALKPGVITITVSSIDNLITDTCRVSVEQPITSVGLNATSLTMKPGDFYQLKSNINEGATGEVTYTSSNPFAVYVDKNTGLITALEDGQAIITATAGKKSASCYVRVLTPVERLEFNFSNNIIKREGNEIWILEDLSGGLPVNLTASIYPQTASVKTLTILQPQTLEQDVEDIKNSSSVISIPDTKTGTLQLVTTISPNCKGKASLTIQYDNNKTEKIIVNVVRKVEGIDLIKDTLTTTNIRFNSFRNEWEQNSLELDYKFTPERPTNQNLIWTSSEPEVALINETEGLIIPLKAGSTIITVTTEDGSFSDSCLLTVEQPTTGLKYTLEETQSEEIPSITNPVPFLSEDKNVTMIENTTLKVNSIIIPEDATYKDVTFTSSDNNIATIDEQGLITAVSEGTTQISITTNTEPSYKQEFNLIVVKPIQSVEITNEKNLILKTNETLQMSYLINPANATNKNITWSSSNPEVATISSDGLVTTLKAGTVDLTITTEDGQLTDTYSLIVKNRVTNLTITNKINTINAKQTHQLNVELEPENLKDNTLTFDSSDSTIATINELGLITALNRGQTTITVTSNCNPLIFDNFTLTVNQLAEDLIVEDNLIIELNKTYQLNPIVLPDDANTKDLIYTSLNPEILKVSETGLITALSKGEGKVEIKTNDNAVTKIINISVIIKPTDLTILDIPDKIDRTYSNSILARYLINPSNSSTCIVKWSSSDDKIAKVDDTGLINILNDGEVTITATIPEYNLTSSKTLTVYSSATSFTIDRPEIMYDNKEYDWTINLTPETATKGVKYQLAINNETVDLTNNQYTLHFNKQEAGIHYITIILINAERNEKLSIRSFSYEVLNSEKETNTKIENITSTEGNLTITPFGEIVVTYPQGTNFNPNDLKFDIPEGAKQEIIKTGDNEYKIVITSKDGSTKKEYPVKIEIQKSNNTKILQVKVNETLATINDNLIIASLKTGTDLTNLTFDITLEDKNATYKISEDKKNLIVTAEDGSTKTYTLIITAEESNAKLDYISVGGKYAIQGIDTLYIKADCKEPLNITAEDPNAIITKEVVEETENYIKYIIKITSGDETLEYKLHFDYTEPNPDYKAPIYDDNNNNQDNDDFNNDDNDDFNNSNNSSSSSGNNSNNNSTFNNTTNNNSNSNSNNNNNTSNSNSNNKNNLTSSNNTNKNNTSTQSNSTLKELLSNSNNSGMPLEETIINKENNITGLTNKNSDIILISQEDKDKIIQNKDNFKDLTISNKNTITNKNNTQILTPAEFLTNELKENTQTQITNNNTNSNKYSIKENIDGTFTLILPSSTPSNLFTQENISYNPVNNKYYLTTDLLGTIELNAKTVSTLEMQIDSNIAYVDGKAKFLKDTAVIYGEEVYLPMRLVLEYLGADVNWSQEKHEASFKLGNTTLRLDVNQLSDDYNILNERIYTTPEELINIFNLGEETISGDSTSNIVEILKDITNITNLPTTTLVSNTYNF